MNINNLEQLTLRGEILLLQEQVDFFAREQDFWRSKYLAEHPELDNWDYAETAAAAAHHNER